MGDCEFYNEIERIIPCDGTPNAYATEYGYRYCNRFAQFSSDFTSEVSNIPNNINNYSYFGFPHRQGQMWVNGVRPCLQRAIINTVIDPATTCKILKDAAFDSHPLCYVKMEPSFCNVVLKPGNWDGFYNVFIFSDLFTEESKKQVFV